MANGDSTRNLAEQRLLELERKQAELELKHNNLLEMLRHALALQKNWVDRELHYVGDPRPRSERQKKPRRDD